MKNLWLLLIVVLIFACKKEPTKEKTKTELLTQKNWKRISLIDLNDGQSLFEACATDDMYTFNTNGKFYYHPGTVKCGLEAAHTDNWSFSAEDSLKIGVTSYYISKLTEDTLTYLQYGWLEYKYVH